MSLIPTILLSGIVVILILIFIQLFALYQKISLIASRMGSAPSKPAPQAAIPEISKNEIEVESGSLFEEFLNEDLQRRDLGKKEQFAAFRAWRSAKGLNWSK
jgi:hypothetical protein